MPKNKYLRWVTTGYGMLQNQNEPKRNNEIRITTHNENSINLQKIIKGETEDIKKSILSDKYNE